MQDRAFANEKVDFIWDSVVKEIQGNDIKVSNVLIENVKTGQVTDHAFGGVFIYVGMIPVTGMVSELGITDSEGWIVTDDHMRTSIIVFLRLEMFVKKTFVRSQQLLEMVQLLVKEFIITLRICRHKARRSGAAAHSF